MHSSDDLHQLIWGGSPAILSLIAEIRSLARHGCRSLLVIGESGTGKDLVPRALHRVMSSTGSPYEVFNCPAIPTDHLEAELFGTTRGAFPGAIDRQGAAERAAGGLLFLDEVATMPLDHQAKVLRLLECGEGRRVGGTRTYRAELTVVAASNEDLAAWVGEGRFREDLFYRLTQDGMLWVPPLRERREDITVLAEGFLAQLREPACLDNRARACLARHDWPGNVRQLRAVVRIAARLAPARTIEAHHVEQALERLRVPRPPSSSNQPERVPAKEEFLTATDALRRRLLADALAASGGNQTVAGLLLGLHRRKGEGGPILVDRRARKLAHRKFRYWWGQLQADSALAPLPPT